MFLDKSQCYVLSIQGYMDQEEEPLLLRHEIRNMDGKFYLSAGIMLDEECRSSIEEVITNKQKEDKFEVTPENMIGKSQSMILLYCEKSVREFWITIAGKDIKIKAQVPSLVFKIKKRGGVDVASYKGIGRPSMDTELYHAPFGNINDRGHMCIGGNKIKWPVTSSESVFNMFFGSAFNEMQNPGGIKGVMTINDLEKFWMQIRKRKKFDETKLTPIKDLYQKVTLKEWID